MEVIMETAVTMKKGTRLREFVLDDEIGSGGNAVVWKAVDTTLNRNVAIKRPFRKGGIELSKDEIEEFKREAQRGASLVHSNIVQVYQIIEEANDLFLVLEYVDGPSLWDDFRNRARDGSALPLDQSISILKDILLGLSYAHAQQICHRDLKPANILLTSSRIPKIADLGLARALSSETLQLHAHSSSRQGGTGTPEFMSPEQARGEDADAQSDLFMVGIIGYLLLSGRHPFAHPSGLFQISEMLLDDDFSPAPLRSPSSMASGDSRLFKEYAAVVMRLLERERASRFRTAQDAVRAIDAISPFIDCPNCGSRVPETNRYCGQCGEQIVEEAPTEVAPIGHGQTARELDQEGFRLARQQRWDEAIAHYRRSIDLDGTFQRTFWNLAYALNHVGRYEQAIEFATTGLGLQEREPRHTANLLGVRAFSFGKLKRYEDAINDLNDAIALDHDGVEHFYSRARVHAYMGNVALARADARSVLARNPDHLGALRLMNEVGDEPIPALV
jgi:serine/threonine protein kinase